MSGQQGPQDNRVMNYPEDSATKMFVGQIPRMWGERELLSLFNEFGEVFDLQILKDRITGQSRGCCFVTFYSKSAASAAQNSLNDIRTLPGMMNPVQMRPADVEKRAERRLFIGMLPITCDEYNLRNIFEQFGKIQEVQVLRNSNGTSRRCAFLTFSCRAEAMSAMKKMNQSYLSSACTQPIVVKFADTPREKEKRKLERQLKTCAFQLQKLCSDEDDIVGKLLLPSICNLALNSNLCNISPAPWMGADKNASAPKKTHGVVANASSGSIDSQLSESNDSNSDNGVGAGDSIGGTRSGPPGANLFVYHLPKRFTDKDLFQLFSRIGNIISAKVYVDRQTHESKCFGFVSFLQPYEAAMAIKQFNGYQVDEKRLKVEIKKSKKGFTIQNTSQDRGDQPVKMNLIDLMTQTDEPLIEPPFLTDLLD